jgi:Niemann-Pick C2 protein
MFRTILSLFAIILVINGINCIDFNDCGSTTGKITSITVTGCSSGADECYFKVGTNVSIDVQFSSGLTAN